MIRSQIPDDRIEELKEAENYLFKVTFSENNVINNDKLIAKLNEKNSTSKNKKGIKQNERRIKELQKKTKKELVNIANLYYSNYVNIYSVYRDRLFMYQTTNRSKRLKVNRLISRAKKMKSEIRLILKNVSETKSYNELKKHINNINLLRVEGIDKLHESFCTYIDCYKFTATSNNNQTNNLKQNKGTTIKNNKNVVFKIQILAVSKRANIYSLQKKYDLTNVEESYSKDLQLYRYTVGKFYDYYTAKDYSENIVINEAFIVGYINGKRAKIEDAIYKSGINY